MSLFKDFAGEAANMYHDYWSRKNQELREQARAAQYNDLVEATQDEYYRVTTYTSATRLSGLQWLIAFTVPLSNAYAHRADTNTIRQSSNRMPQ